jgi:tetratricopeptide (TPR) repeat protein
MNIRNRANGYLLGVAFFLCLFCGAARASDQQAKSDRDQIAQHVAQAKAATQEGKFASAEEEWKKVLELDPHSAQAFSNLGMVYYLEHKYLEAEKALRNALQIDHALASSQVLLGAALGRQGKLKDAVTELERAVKSELNQSAEKTARVALHEVLFAQGNYDRALIVLEPMAKKYPQDVDVLYNMGQTHLQLATQNFQRIVQVSPESYRVHQILAESFAQQGQYREAINEFRLALAQKPDLPGAHYQVGWLCWTNQHDAEGERAALSEFEAELKINPFDAVSEYRLGRIYWKWKDLPNAHRHYQRAVDLDAKYVLPRIGLARVLELQGDLQEAQKQLGLAAKLDPENATVHYRLAQLHKQLSDPTAAAKELHRFERIRKHQGGAQTQLERLLQRQTKQETEDLGD